MGQSPAKWPLRQSEFTSCEEDPRDPSMKIIRFLATEQLVNIIRMSPEIKINITSTYVCYGKTTLSPNVSVMFDYNA